MHFREQITNDSFHFQMSRVDYFTETSFEMTHTGFQPLTTFLEELHRSFSHESADCSTSRVDASVTYIVVAFAAVLSTGGRRYCKCILVHFRPVFLWRPFAVRNPQGLSRRGRAQACTSCCA